jgi:hypothetical protein
MQTFAFTDDYPQVINLLHFLQLGDLPTYFDKAFKV